MAVNYFFGRATTAAGGDSKQEAIGDRYYYSKASAPLLFCVFLSLPNRWTSLLYN